MSIEPPGVLFASDSAPGHIRALFRYYAEITRRGVAEALPTRDPWRSLYELLPAFVFRPAKTLRPVLCLATCRAFGGSVDDAIPVAVAFELIHNAFLVHDDIEDDSATRRGGPSLHAEHGVPLALNAGDALSTLAMDEVVQGAERLGTRLGLVVVGEFERLVLETIEGQAIELGWQRERTTDLTAADYLSMILKKTSWYTAIQPVRIGALIGSQGNVDPDYGIRFGYYLGGMFQMANDLAGLIGDGWPGGRRPGTDLVEGKRSLMIIHLLSQVSGRDRDRVLSFLHLERQERSPDEVAWLLDLMRRSRSVDYGRAWLRAMADAALLEADAAFGWLPPSDDRDLLFAIVPELMHIHQGLYDVIMPEDGSPAETMASPELFRDPD